jgi:hypothetical protein
VAGLAVLVIRRPDDRRPRLGLLLTGAVLVAGPFVSGSVGNAGDARSVIEDLSDLVTPARVTGVQDDLAVVRAAADELGTEAFPALESDTYRPGTALPAVSDFLTAWPDLEERAGELVTTMRLHVDDVVAADALPPFSLVPWFFVIPGAFVVALTVRSSRVR